MLYYDFNVRALNEFDIGYNSIQLISFVKCFVKHLKIPSNMENTVKLYNVRGAEYGS